MPTTKISELTALASVPAPTDQLVVNDGTVTKKINYSVLMTQAVNVKSYGAIGDGTSDDSTAIQNAINAATGAVYFPPGTYQLFSDVTIKSGITLFGDGASSVLRKDVSASGLYDEMIFRSTGTTAIADVVIARLKFTTEQVSSSGNKSLLNFDAGNVDRVTIQDCVFDVPSAYANCAFFKAPAGYTVSKISFLNNRIIQCPRMGIEVINHDNGSNYNATEIVVAGNHFEACDFGVSLSGPVESSVVANNHFEFYAGSLYGVELVGVSSCVVDSNTFKGDFTHLISSSGSGTYPAGRGIVISNNTTAGTVDGKVYLNNAGNAEVTGNYFRIDDYMEISGSFSDGCFISGNQIITDGNYAIICDNSPNHIIQGNILDNSASASNFAVVRAFNSGATGIILKDNHLSQGTGGTSYDTASGGAFSLVRGNIINGLIDENVLPKRTFKFTRRITPVGTTTTATIAFPGGASWSPNIVKVTAAAVGTSGANGGTCSSIYGVRTVNGTTAASNENTDLMTSSNISIARTYGTNEFTMTATVTAGVRVIWDIEVITYENGEVTATYA